MMKTIAFSLTFIVLVGLVCGMFGENYIITCDIVVVRDLDK